MGGLSNYGEAPKPPRRRGVDTSLDPHRPEPLHSLEPSPELAEKWEKVRARLEQASADFLWHVWLMHPQAVYENGRTIYVEAPAHMFTTISVRYDGHILLAAREALGDDKITIEYVRHGWRPEGHEVEQPAGQRKAEEMPETQRQKRGAIANAPAKALERTAEALIESALEAGADATSTVVEGLRESAEKARESQERPAEPPHPTRRRRSDAP